MARIANSAGGNSWFHHGETPCFNMISACFAMVKHHGFAMIFHHLATSNWQSHDAVQTPEDLHDTLQSGAKLRSDDWEMGGFFGGLMIFNAASLVHKTWRCLELFLL